MGTSGPVGHAGAALHVLDRSRWFRESLVEVVGRAGQHAAGYVGGSEGDLLDRLAEGSGAATVAVEVARQTPWDPDTLLPRLQAEGVARIVGVTPIRSQRRRPEFTTVSRSAPVAELVAALSPGHTPPAVELMMTVVRRPGDQPLTERQLAVLAMLSSGMRSREVAERFGVATTSIERTKQATYQALGVSSQTQAIAVAVREGWLGPATGPVAGDQGYDRPRLRRHRWRRERLTVLVIHEIRLVAEALRAGLGAEGQVVADTVFGTVALQLSDVVTPDVIVAGEHLADGPLRHFLPDFVRTGSRVVVLSDGEEPSGALDLLANGAVGWCSQGDRAERVVDVVREVGRGGAVLPPRAAAAVLSEWRLGSGRQAAGRLPELTVREVEVLDGILDGLSTKAIARALGMAVKTVENHKTRIFAKLGVNGHAEAVALVGGARGGGGARAGGARRLDVR